jgi:capsular polysaccharide transport system permease protein
MRTRALQATPCALEIMNASSSIHPAVPRTGFQIQRDVIYALVLREMGSRFGKSRVGFLWVLAEPVAHLVFPIVMFSFIRDRSLAGVEYPVFLVYGFLPFLLFKTICTQTMEGTNTSRGLLSYRQVLLMDVFIARALAYCAIEAIVFAIVLSGLALLAYDVLPPAPIELAGVLLLSVALGFGLGLLFAALSSIVPDARAVIRILFMPLYFASGVLFPVSRFPDAWVDALAWNPVLHLVEMSRSAGIEHYKPMHQLAVSYPLAIAAVSLFLGLAMYRLRYLARVTT